MIGGAILAAGRGSRFGGPKAAAELDGHALVEHALEAMLRVPAVERVVVVLGFEEERVREAAPLLAEADEVVLCERWAEGISASLRCAIGALRECEAALITLGDQPLVTPQVIAMIADQADGRAPAARATYDGRPGHPVIIRSGLFEAVSSLRGDDGARDLLAESGVKLIEAGQLCSDADVDTPEELERLRGRTALADAAAGG